MKYRLTLTLLGLVTFGIWSCSAEVSTDRQTQTAPKKTENKESSDQQGQDKSNTAGDETQKDSNTPTPDDNSADQTASTPPASTPTPTPTPTPNPAPTEPAKDPNIVEFKIAAGTAKNPWNDQASTVMVKVGQTLRIINNDTVTHQLHTGGNPFPHGGQIAAGKSVDYKIQSALDPGANPPTYDHIAGQNAKFWLKSVAQ